MTYQWDVAKAAGNLRKHGVDFVEAAAALDDPNRVETADLRFEYGEARSQVLGLALGRVLFVVMTMRDQHICRIIPARKATRREQSIYHARDEAW